MKLRLCNRDEFFVIDLDTVIYFKAEDHYTSVFYGKDVKQLLPFGLSQLEKSINCLHEGERQFLRVGRSHLLSMSRIVHASVVKESVTMMTSMGVFVSLHMSRSLVRDLSCCLKGDGNVEVVANILGGEFPTPSLSHAMTGVRVSNECSLVCRRMPHNLHELFLNNI